MPTRDRLLEFEAKRDQYEVEITREKKGRKFVREEKISMSMSWFRKKIQEMEKKLALIKADVRNLKKMQSNLYWITKKPDLQAKEIVMKNLVEQIMSKSSNFRREIQLLSSASSESNTQREGLIVSETEQQIKSLQIEKLFWELKTTMDDCKTSQVVYVERKKARQIEQRRRIDYPNYEVNISMEPQTATAVLNTSNLQFSEEQNRNSELDQLRDREIELQNIEQETHKIYELFREMYVEVNDRILVDSIEKSMTHAVEKVIQGGKEIMKATKSKCAGRKKIICIILAIIFVILLILLLTYILKK